MEGSISVRYAGWWLVLSASGGALAQPVVDLDTAARGDLWLSGSWLAFTVTESDQQEDMNGDGDCDDTVIHVRDLDGDDNLADTVIHAMDIDLLDSTPRFLRGDCNGDGSVAAGIADAVELLRWELAGGPRPGCLAACDSDGDGAVGGAIADVVYLLRWAFLGGPAPPAPFPRCGVCIAPGDAALGCEAAGACP